MFGVQVLLCFWALIVARDKEEQLETYATPIKILPAVRDRIFGSIFRIFEHSLNALQWSHASVGTRRTCWAASRCLVLEVKRTSIGWRQMSAFDPTRHLDSSDFDLDQTQGRRARIIVKDGLVFCLPLLADFNHCLDFKMRWQTNVVKFFCQRQLPRMSGHSRFAHSTTLCVD